MGKRDRALFGIFRCQRCVMTLLGVCYRGNYCLPERKPLMERAQQAAEALGHQLGEFSKVRGRSTWDAQCLKCGETVRIKLDPLPGELDISGEAIIAIHCSEAESNGDVSE